VIKNKKLNPKMGPLQWTATTRRKQNNAQQQQQQEQ
jgi:hypothetical protein